MRYSKQRNLILDIVRNTDVHPTAKWVYKKAREEMPGIGLATVYRNLNKLVEKGMILRINAIGSEDRYDGNIAEHWHFQCIRCGRVLDLSVGPNKQQNDIKESIRDTFGIDDKNIMLSQMVISGVCNDCLE